MTDGIDFTIKSGDTHPAFLYTIVDGDGTVVDLTGCTVEFILRSQDGTVGPFQIDTTITNPTAGQTSTLFSNPDWTATPGMYDGEFHVTFGDATKEAYPTTGFLKIEVDDKLPES